MNDTASDIPISLIRGGSFYWIQEKARLIRPHAWDLQRRLPLAIAVTWLPLLVLAYVQGGWPNSQELLTDYRVNSRLLVAIPLLLIGQITMENRFREMAQHFLDANIIRLEELPRFREIMQAAIKLRDAKLPEIIAMILVYAQIGYFLQSGRLHFAAWAVDSHSNAISPAGYYSVLVGHALFLGLLALAMWKWMIWIYVLYQISRMNLQLDATNGDLAAGLGFLAAVPRAFVPVVLSISTVIGSTWRAQVLAGQQTLSSLKGPAGLLVVIVLLIFCLPLVLFTPRLQREKREASLKYGALQHLLSLQFRAKWAEHRNEHIEELLGTPDVSSLADISSSFKNVEEMKGFPFQKGTAISLLAALALPMVPVVTTQIPFKELIKDLFEAIH